MFYGTVVVGLASCSITGFSLHVGHDIPHIGQLLPDIWVDGKKLYQYRTLNNEDRKRYMLTYHKSFDPYQYPEDDTGVVRTVYNLAPW